MADRFLSSQRLISSILKESCLSAQRDLEVVLYVGYHNAVRFVTVAYFQTCARSVPFTPTYIEQGFVMSDSLFREFANPCSGASPFDLGSLPALSK